MKQIILFETGAKNMYVNELILFTDTTNELAILRDLIYKSRIKFEKINPLLFKPLFKAAIELYKSEFKNDYSLWAKMYYLPNAQIAEYCRLYASDFKNWKLSKKHPLKN